MITCNDEVISKVVRVNFRRRGRLQALFLIMFLLIFSCRVYLGQSFELVVKAVTVLYLITDLFLIAKRVKFEELSINVKNYSDFKVGERVRGSIIGGLNIMLLFFLFME